MNNSKLEDIGNLSETGVTPETQSPSPEVIQISQELLDKKPVDNSEALEKIKNDLGINDIETISKDVTNEKNEIKVSVVVNAFNEEAAIGDLLNDLQEEWFPGMEVIVSNDGSTDKTAEIVRTFKEENDADWLQLDSHLNLGFAGARNSGAGFSGGSYDLLTKKSSYNMFFDGDARVPKGFIQSSITELEKKGLDVGSHYLTPDRKGFMNKVSMILANQGIRKSMSGKSKRPIIAGGGGVIIKKQLFDELGGVPNAVVSEDMKWARVLQEHGAHIGMLEDMKMPVNMRRFEEEGHIRTLLKWAKASRKHERGEEFKKGEMDYEPVREEKK